MHFLALFEEPHVAPRQRPPTPSVGLAAAVGLLRRSPKKNIIEHYGDHWR